MKKIFAVIFALFISVNMISCSQLYDNTSEVSLDDAGTLLDYTTGEVIDVRPVRIKDTGAGAAVGAVLGGVLGSFVGEGKANTLATLLGALGGAFLGYKADTANAQELHVRLDDGRDAIIIVKGTVFKPGDRIRIVYRGSRIVKVTKISN
jgi:outer membrane lipoprotein SlyB